MNAKDVATMTGVSVRTLHHYDQIGLLCPHRGNNRYREYVEEDLDKLQQILFFKECGFSLKKIKFLLDSPTFDKTQAFAIQEKYLLHEKLRIETMLDTLRKTMKATKGEILMSRKDKFAGFDLNESNPYEKEVRDRWGDEAIEHMNSIPKLEKSKISNEMNALFGELAEMRNESPQSQKVQVGMDKMYRFFNQNFGYKYSIEDFANIGRSIQ